MTLLHWQIQSGGVRACNVHRRTWQNGQGCTAHAHDYCELFWVEAGMVDHTWEGEVTVLVPGDLVALVPGETHALQAHGRAAATVVNLSLAAAEAEAARRHCGPQQRWPWAGTRAERHQVLVPEARAGLHHVIGLVDLSLPSSRDLLLLGVIHGLARSDRGGLAALPPAFRPDVLLALHEDPGLGVRALAQRLRCSREGLTRSCRRAGGRPLADGLRDWRLDRAAELMRTTDSGIAGIGTECGFAALGGFYKAFARRHGMAPGAWRLALSQQVMR